MLLPVPLPSLAAEPGIAIAGQIDQTALPHQAEEVDHCSPTWGFRRSRQARMGQSVQVALDFPCVWSGPQKATS